MPGDVSLVFVLFGVGAGVLFAPIIWLSSARHASLVKWNEEGVTVTWYRGPARHYRWEDLAEMRTGHTSRGGRGAQLGEAGDYATVRTAAGSKWTIWEGKGGYEELLEALKAHLWARAEGAIDGGQIKTSPTECLWCGATFAAATTQCPQCGRPVPPAHP